jgi:hypothetical protein
MLILAGAGACASDVAWPEPAPPGRWRAHDDMATPGTKLQLWRVAVRARDGKVRVTNHEPFGLTLLDHIWLMVPVRSDDETSPPGGPYIVDRRRHGQHVHLRCPMPHSIPVGSEFEFSFDDCFITMYEPPVRLTSFRLVAREGQVQRNFDGPPEVIRGRQ